MKQPNANPAVQFLNTDSDAKLIACAQAILEAMSGNLNFPSPTPELPTVRDAVTTFAMAWADVTDGNPAMNVAKNAARKMLVRLLRQLAGHVQATAKGDTAIILSSGFSIHFPATRLIGPLPTHSDFMASMGFRRSEFYSNEMTAFSAH